jgi:hypothetical protein
MLTRSDELTPHETFISDNLTHKPDVAQSAFDNFSAGIVTAPYAIKSFDNEFNQSPRGKTVAATFDALKRGNENPEVGWIQWGVNEAANMLGQSLNPFGFLMAEAGGLAVKPLTAVSSRVAPQLFRRPIKELLGETMGKYFPETIGSEAEKQTLSMGLFGKELTKGFGIGAGAVLPQEVLDNFNAETGKHDILGIAKGMGAGGVFGMSIATIPFAWGILKANVNRLRGLPINSPISSGDADKALVDGHITKDDYNLLKDIQTYVENPDSRQDLKEGTYYRGYPFDIDLHGQVNDPIFGKGYWMSPDKEYASGYGGIKKQIDIIKGRFKIYDWSNESTEEHLKHPTKEKLRDFLIKNGYDGVSRNNGKAEEIMLFFKPKNVKPLHEKTTKYISEQGHPVDHANDTAQFEILNRDQINNLQSATVDQLVSDNIPEEHRNALSDFTVQAGIDEMRNKPNLLDGVRGYVEYMDSNLANKDSILARADKLVSDHIELAANESHGFDQQAIKGMIERIGSESQHPFSVPKEVQERIRQDKQISELTRKNDKLFSEYERTGNSALTKKMKDNNEKIEEIKKELVPLKSAMEELHDIKEKILPVKNDLRQMKEYQRLADLAEVWSPAQTLLDRVHLEEEIRSQEAYRDLARQMLDIADSNAGAAARVENINGYMEARTKQRIDEPNPRAELIELAKKNEVPADADAMVAEHDQMVNSFDHEETKKEYEFARDKYSEFKKSGNIFQNFIKCVIGSQK